MHKSAGLILVVSLLGACGDNSEQTDAAVLVDASLRADATVDTGAGTSADAGSVLDASSIDAPALSDPDAPLLVDAWASSVGRLCLFHSQCDPGQRCEPGGIGSPARCAVSAVPRGPLGFEATCASDNDCAEGVCWSSGAPGVGMRCSKPCVTSADCGTVLNTCRVYGRTEFSFCDHTSM